jgi:hypothetical protein
MLLLSAKRTARLLHEVLCECVVYGVACAVMPVRHCCADGTSAAAGGGSLRALSWAFVVLPCCHTS